MIQLTLLRHAHAAWPDHQTRDFDRPLDALGRKGLAVIAPYLARSISAVDRLLLSPALRAVQSYELLAAHMALPKPVLDKSLYMASEDQLFDILHAQEDAVCHLMIIGHNPGLQDMLRHIAPPENAPLHFPTSAFAQLETAGTWAEWAENNVRLKAFNWPQNINPDVEADQ